ncbi:hypothetical protein HN018_26465 (plasmid) [Lichenicola cladoniae]|uniref:Uncharacterized protein n=1 Tax=Lichenicola cladoniae TaxID=1484109 RepID=A0A6M8HYN6_9PROT|nr:hypothetical protein [Lichenicola cladoniae]NPD69332.1 hypothetical protein [Acetobacteraceae bacterium]QKE93684.1 hypothetical protein HN018_26465 [Lichenicola cladoniae]
MIKWFKPTEGAGTRMEGQFVALAKIAQRLSEDDRLTLLEVARKLSSSPISSFKSEDA